MNTAKEKIIQALQKLQINLTFQIDEVEVKLSGIEVEILSKIQRQREAVVFMNIKLQEYEKHVINTENNNIKIRNLEHLKERLKLQEEKLLESEHQLADRVNSRITDKS